MDKAFFQTLSLYTFIAILLNKKDRRTESPFCISKIKLRKDYVSQLINQTQFTLLLHQCLCSASPALVLSCRALHRIWKNKLYQTHSSRSPLRPGALAFASLEIITSVNGILHVPGGKCFSLHHPVLPTREWKWQGSHDILKGED